MLFRWKNSVGLAIVLLIAIFLVTVYTKPRFLYDREKGRFKDFRTGRGGTLFPLWIIAVVAGILVYVIAILLIRPFEELPVPMPVSMPPMTMMSSAPVSGSIPIQAGGGGGWGGSVPMNSSVAQSYFYDLNKSRVWRDF